MSASPAASEQPEPPRSFLDKIGAALPIALTALATIFASMSNGALQEAMYWKSQAAQDQSRATNQWSLAGFKRDRALIMLATAAQLRAQCGYATADFALPSDAKDDTRKALAWLTEKGDKGGPPRVNLPTIEDAHIKELRDAIEKRESERDQQAKAALVPLARINAVIDDAEKFSEQTDKEWKPVLEAAAALVALTTSAAGAEKKDAATATVALGFDLEERRYRAESRLNQGIGFLYEVRTKVSGAASDKHRRKSTFLSYAMLVAQIGAVASSLALARKQKSSLWLFAGVVGLVSVGVGGYAILPPLLGM
jgi:hypothetical protein